MTFENLDQTRPLRVRPGGLPMFKDTFLPISERLQLESYDDTDKGDDELITVMPFACRNSWLFMR